jgi:hypothetical protein
LSPGARALERSHPGHEAILAEQRAIELLREHRDEDLETVLRARLAAFSPTSCSPRLTP